MTVRGEKLAQEHDEEALNAALNTPTDQLEEQVVETEEQSEVENTEHTEQESVEEDDHPKVSRAQQRIQKLAEERATERAAREAAERERDFYRQQALQRQQPEEELDPDEKWRRDANARIQRTEMMAADVADRSAFLSKFSKDPEVLSLQEEVEAKLAQARAAGANPARENILKFILGERALDRRAKAPAVRKQAADRVSAAKGQPLGTKSNVASSKSEPSLYDRLKDVPL